MLHSEKLQLKNDLTLEQAVTMVRQSEEVRQQQEILRGSSQALGTTGELNAVKSQTFIRQQTRGQQVRVSGQSATPHSRCQWCGRTKHDRKECPARNARCNTCGINGHFASVCRKKRQQHVAAVEKYDSAEEEEAVFLDSVTTSLSPWTAEICFNGLISLVMKIDSGADVCCISTAEHHRLQCDLRPSDRPLIGPDPKRLDVAGMFTATLEYKGRCMDTNVYVLSQVSMPLLSRLAATQLEILACIDAVFEAKQLIIKQYPELFKGLGHMRQPYSIRLKPEAQPYAVFAPRRVPLPLLPKVQEELDRLLRLDVIARVDEPTQWCAPIVVAPKGPGIRLCVDLSQLNSSVMRERHIMPSVDQTLARLAGARVFSKLDCYNAFLQIPLTAESQLLTTFITPFGRYCFKRVPYGISSAPEHFQKRMSSILQGIDGVVCLIDDILVVGRDQQEHDSRLHAILRRLRDANVTLNTPKCEVSVSQVKFVGHIVSAEGIQPDPDKITAIVNMAAPTNISEVRCLLGMINQLAKFSPNLATLSAPIRELLRKNTEWSWSSVQDDAFSKIKKAICSAPTLALYDTNKPTLVCADSSSYGLGGALLQRQADDSWRPVTFVSRSLTDTEKRYAQIEKEALAITWCCERLAEYLVGLTFNIHNDHKPLQYLLSAAKPLDAVPPRIQRFRLRLMRFDYSLSYVPGVTLCTADTLSRFPLKYSESHLGDIDAFVATVVGSIPIGDIVLEEIRTATATDRHLQDVVHYCQSEWPHTATLSPEVQQYAHSREHLTVCEGLVMCDARIVIPPSLRGKFLNALHVGHLGIVKARAKARQSIWWPKMGDAIERHVTACGTCAHWRTPATEPMMSAPLPDLPWQKIGTDLFELNNKKYVVVVDYYSRYLEIVELRNETSADVIQALKSIFSRHGVPMVVFSDNGPCYSAAQFNEFAKVYGFRHDTSSPKYAQSNGAAEKAVQTAKAILRKATDPFLALLSLRTTPLSNGYSPAQLLMGRQLRSTVPTTQAALQPQTPNAAKLHQLEQEAKERQAFHYNKRHRVQEGEKWQVGDKVWIPDLHAKAAVISVLPHRDYQLRTAAGSLVRRNGRLLRHPLSAAANATRVSSEPGGFVKRCRILSEQEVPQPVLQPVQPDVRLPGATRSGRVPKRPNRLTL